MLLLPLQLQRPASGAAAAAAGSSWKQLSRLPLRSQSTRFLEKATITTWLKAAANHDITSLLGGSGAAEMALL